MRVLRVAHHGVVSAWRARERRLRELGFDVRMVSAESWNEGGRVVELDLDDDAFVTGARTIGTHPNAFLYNPRPIWRLLGAKPDIIDLHEEPFSLATAEVLLLRRLRRSRAPYVLYSAQNIEKRYPIPFRWFERAALRGAAAAYVCNREAGEILVRKGLRGPAQLIPLGVDTAQFSQGARTAPRDGPVIGYVGRLEPYKGVATLLRAAASRPEWRIEITGDGPQHAELVALVAELGIADRVSFLGFAQGDELADRYRRLDLLAVPSVPWPGWLEQFCRVAVEAMASGVPVVASRSGAIPDVVADAGVLVEPGDPDALRDGIDSALVDARWGELRAAGLARADQFTWERVAEQQSALYRAVVPTCDGGAARPPQVVAIAYGDPTLLDGALEELGEGFAVTIVDNSSSAATKVLAQRRGAHYVDPGANLGFGAGVNVALRSLADRGLSGDDVLLLNPDARIGGAAVHHMHRALHSGARIAAVGATQVDPATGQPSRVWWPFPSPARAWIDALGLGRFDRGHGFAIGSVLLLRAEAIADIGAFDERFFLYAEEVDWQKRARDAGWSIAVASVEASHIGAGTGGDGTRREAMFFASNEKYQRKHFGAAGWQIFRAGVIVGATVRALVAGGDARRAARRRRAIFLEGPVAYSERIT
ncbi:glycosyltransferase [Microbacterium sulfonylureivorans]|uniref:glycosyltransferase n=1 Tax=Microbacterium sulfonylureivorans TaxID=2486854 RepID=UPI000FDBFC17|nr:glycosyltransferase [Microbacterium sulfonylureivorans]